jgi:signal transduction histidine kinase/ActR/RegA family two-component response regulator
VLLSEESGVEGKFLACPEQGFEALRERHWGAVVLALPAGEIDLSAAVRPVVVLARGAPVVVVAEGLGEEGAARVMRLGAADVLARKNLARLPGVLRRQLASRRPPRREEDAPWGNEERFRATLEGTQEAIYWLESVRDEGGKIVDFEFVEMNHQGEVELSKKREELLGRTICEVFPINRTGGFFEQYRRVAETQEMFSQEYIVPPGNAASGHYHHTVLPVGDGVAIFNRNISAQKHAEAEQSRLQEELSQARRMEALGVLAGGIAHDFNNLLATILASSEVLAMGLRGTPGVDRLLGLIQHQQTAVQRGARLVQQILTFSRQAVHKKAPTRLARVAQETLAFLAKIAPASVQIRSDCDPSLSILADTTQIHQVLMNLCTNALQAMEDKGGELVLCIERVDVDPEKAPQLRELQPGPHACIRVSDTGIGMDPETLDRVFEPFFSTKQAGKGTGLGMAVVHGIVSEYEGAIRIQTEVGRGTTVEVWLPALSGEVDEPASPTASAPQEGTERVLLVDDEEDLLQSLTVLLQDAGYRVTASSSSTAALARFEEDPGGYDVALLDLSMPELGGLDLARRLRQLRPELPILLMSGFGGEQVSSPRELGIFDFLQKPLSREVITHRLRAALDAAENKEREAPPGAGELS